MSQVALQGTLGQAGKQWECTQLSHAHVPSPCLTTDKDQVKLPPDGD